MTQQQFCNSCGAKLKPDSQFCSHCGAKVATSKPESGATKKCSHCQTDMPANAVKCPHCGSWLKEISEWMNIARWSYILGLVVFAIWLNWVCLHRRLPPFVGPTLLLWVIIIICLIIYFVYGYKVYKRPGMWF